MKLIKNKKKKPDDHWTVVYSKLSPKHKMVFWIAFSCILIVFTTALVIALLLTFHVIYL